MISHVRWTMLVFLSCLAAPTVAQTGQIDRVPDHHLETVQQLRSSPRLTDAERQRAVDYFRESRTDQLSHIDLSVTVGERVPRTIALYDLPQAILTLAPSYRGFRYARSRQKIYIIDPETLTVIDIIPLTGGDRAGLDFSAAEIALLQRSLSQAPIDIESPWRLGLGAELPASVALHPFPEELRTRLPALARYRYLRTGDELLIIEPSDRDVVVIIPIEAE